MMNQVVALAKGKQGRILRRSRGGFGSGSCRPLQVPAYHPSRPETWHCTKGNARRQKVTGRRERCSKPFTEMPPKEERSDTEKHDWKLSLHELRLSQKGLVKHVKPLIHPQSRNTWI